MIFSAILRANKCQGSSFSYERARRSTGNEKGSGEEKIYKAGGMKKINNSLGLGNNFRSLTNYNMLTPAPPPPRCSQKGLV